MESNSESCFDRMDCAPLRVPDQSSRRRRNTRDVGPVSTELTIQREQCYRGLARCKVLEGSILAEGTVEYNTVSGSIITNRRISNRALFESIS